GASAVPARRFDGFAAARLVSPPCARWWAVSAPPRGGPDATLQEDSHGRPQEEDLQGQEPQPPGERVAPRPAGPQRLPALQRGEAAPRAVRQLRWVRRPGGRRGRLTRALR